jgi:hypothetical protein
LRFGLSECVIEELTGSGRAIRDFVTEIQRLRGIAQSGEPAAELRDIGSLHKPIARQLALNAEVEVHFVW